MNKFYSSYELKYINRWQSSLFSNSLQNFPVIVLTGARQVGKSTFLRNDKNLKGWKYCTLDDFDILHQVKNDPESLWANTNHIIIDEAQKAPTLLSAIKKAVDLSKRQIHFVVSGSANLLLMKKVCESLAGRADYFILSPMAYSEMKGENYNRLLEKLLNKKLPDNIKREVIIDDILIKGFMPPLLRFKKIEDIPKWWESYTATYLERDLRELSQIDFLPDFRNLMKILALRTGNILNKSEVARDANLSQPTTHRYINLLQTSHIIEIIPAYFRNRTKRLIKSPKVYWMDPSFSIYLSGYYDKRTLTKSREYGSFFEALVYHHLRIMANLLKPKANIYYWRTVYGDEVDFIIEYGNKIIPIEVKSSERVHQKDLKALRVFLKEYPFTIMGIVVYRGNDIVQLGKKIFAVPIASFL